MPATCGKRRRFKENGNEKSTLGWDQKETVEKFWTHNEESDIRECATRRTY